MALLNVIKRDGRLVNYNGEKIKNAIVKAIVATLGSYTEEDLDKVSKIEELVFFSMIEDAKELNINKFDIEYIQNHIIEELNNIEEYVQVSLAYNEYRLARDKAREQMKNIEFMTDQLNDVSVSNENGNKDSRAFYTKRDLLAGLVSKADGLKLLPKVVANAHISGDIHFHDLDYSPSSSMFNCDLPNFFNMLKYGFKMGNAQIASPSSINTATAQIAQAIQSIASSQYGGLSVGFIDVLLAPYAEMNYNKHVAFLSTIISDEDKIDEAAKKLTIKDIYDSMQSLEYAINSLFSSNGQTPFSTVGFGTGTNWFEREIQKAILKVRIEGLGEEKKTAVFPKLIFMIEDGLNFKPEDPNYDIKQMALECSSKRMYPDVEFKDNLMKIIGAAPFSMGCRSFLSAYKPDTVEELYYVLNNTEPYLPDDDELVEV